MPDRDHGWLARGRRFLARLRRPAGLAGHPWRTPGPVSRTFGFDRGTPIDRVYIERFLAAHAHDIRGAVLEIGESVYTRRFGTGVTRSDVLHQGTGAPAGAIVADLADAPQLAEGTYDCIIATQTLQHIPDAERPAATLYRLLAPGGVALLTSAALGQISRFDADRWGDYWRFTAHGFRTLLVRACPGAAVEVGAHGSAWTAVAALQGLAAEELAPGELDWRDPDYEVLVTARVVK